MPIVAGDLKVHGSASRPEDDVSTSGGARAADHRPTLDQFTANAAAEVVSDDAADTARTCTVTGRDAAGAFLSDPISVNGTTPTLGAITFERILKCVMSGTHGTATVDVKQGAAGTTRAQIGPNELSSYAMFIKVQSEAGSTENYEKFFWLNDHGTISLESAAVELTADPDTTFFMGLDTAKDSTASVANRRTAPGGVSFVDDNVSQGVPSSPLAAGEAIGVWMRFDRGAAAAALKTSFTTELSGTTV